MNRPRTRTRDALGDRVANNFLGQDMRLVLADLPPGEADFILHLIDGMANNPEKFATPALTEYLNRAVSRLREDLAHEELLAVYYDRPSTHGQGRCRGCHRPLGARTGPGRRPLHCSNRCRQLVWRNRRRAIELIALAAKKCDANNVDPVKNIPTLLAWIRALRAEQRVSR